MKKTLLLCILASALAYTSPAQTGVHVPELAAFDDAMQNLMSTYNVTGAQLAISYKGRLVYNRGFGLADISNNDSVYPNSLFRIASVSKTITGVACMKLFEQGQLDLDALVFGPQGILNDTKYQNILDQRVNQITVRMLLHHSGGWDRDVSADPMFNAYNIAMTMGVPSPPSASDVIRYMLANTQLDFAPGTKSVYSNFGYAVLGRIIEKITGQSYENYVRTAIMAPLGISSIQMGKNLAADRAPNEVTYYDYPGAPLFTSVYDNVTQVPFPYGGFNLEFMDAHGGWIASSEDLVKLVSAFDRFDTRPDILTRATIDTMTKPSAHDPNYAGGIAVNQFNNWWHMGSLPGTTSEIVRAGNRELNWAILLSTRDRFGNINTAVDNLVWEVLPSISSWPAHDLFENTVSFKEPVKYAKAVDFYPNPTNGKVKLSATVDVQVSDFAGQTVMTYKNTTAIDLSNQPAGIYFLTFTGQNGQVLQRSKLVKE